MKGFDDIVLEWDGQEYRVPANRQMELILRVEAGLTKGDPGQQAYSVLTRENGPPIARMAAAYGDALRYAGAPVSDMDVFNKIMAGIRVGDGSVSAIILTCLNIMGVIGSDEEMPGVAGGAEEKKPQAAE